MNAEEARRQKQQLGRYLSWMTQEGTQELPTRLDTMVQPDQISRMEWLKGKCWGEVLEVGCNFGLVSAWCNTKAGIDLNPANVQLAKLLAPERLFEVGDAVRLPFTNGSFDTVMLPEVLEHITWDEIALAIDEAWRVSCEKILITMPDGEDDTPNAINFKHQWLCTTEKLVALTMMIERFGPSKIFIEKKGGFVLIEVTK